ncbi:MAG: bifunctional 4-hydroxy-2-oxoglutarate aldolase/2-dehydro-3-deoxy-phosphogluconate aldolase [Proteobacteria bacterium]|nr:bifunctional 4-hydroxy-2-oxoglutarate aldolase/2-dehydro-3-deoxy-phosphogluconate aldolase [Pseudomonadota bacterium]
MQHYKNNSEFIKEHGLIAIVRGNFSVAKILEIAETLESSQIRIMEVTLNTPNALEAISTLVKKFADKMLIGAGTVRTSSQLKSVIESGAKFSVSPNLDIDSVKLAINNNFLHLPGVFTATEIQNAFVAGCQMVKVFPSEVMGPKYIKALAAPLDDVDFVPTGGINADNLADYIKAGACACGIGSSLVTSPNQTQAELKDNSDKLSAAWRNIKKNG